MFRVAPRLRFIEPQLASPVDQPPEGKHWIHEIKHDGYRCQVLLERGQARVIDRSPCLAVGGVGGVTLTT
jgi:ATP-dependent DNA ligase